MFPRSSAAITFSFQVTWSIAPSTWRIVRASLSAESPTSVWISRPQIAYRRAYASPPARAWTGPCSVRQIRTVSDPAAGLPPTSSSGRAVGDAR
jgi:hypothetical protein